jgi:hypothetical protein
MLLRNLMYHFIILLMTKDKPARTHQRFKRQHGMNLQSVLKEEAIYSSLGSDLMVLYVEPSITKAQSIRKFFDTIELVRKNIKWTQEYKLPDMVRCNNLDMQFEGRQSQYDLLYFMTSNSLYAIDTTDEEFIYQSVTVIIS